MPDLVKEAVFDLWQGDDWYGMARVLAKDADYDMVPVVQADFAAPDGNITYKIEDSDGVEITTGILDAADVILDTPSSGNMWPFKKPFNFIVKFAGANFPDQDKRYHVGIEFTLANGDTSKTRFSPRTKRNQAS